MAISQPFYHRYRISDDVVYGFDSVASLGAGTHTTYVLGKTITLSAIPSGDIRIEFKITQSANDAGYKAYIARNNDTILGTERTGVQTAYTTYVEDIAGWAVGDELRLYYGSQGLVTGISIKELRVLGTCLFDTAREVDGTNT